MNIRKCLLAVVVGVIPGISAANEACVAIENDIARLQCFDDHWKNKTDRTIPLDRKSLEIELLGLANGQKEDRFGNSGGPITGQLGTRFLQFHLLPEKDDPTTSSCKFVLNNSLAGPASIHSSISQSSENRLYLEYETHAFDLRDVDIGKSNEGRIVLHRNKRISYMKYSATAAAFVSLDEDLHMTTQWPQDTWIMNGCCVYRGDAAPFYSRERTGVIDLAAAYPEDSAEIYATFYQLVEACQNN